MMWNPGLGHSPLLHFPIADVQERVISQVLRLVLAAELHVPGTFGIWGLWEMWRIPELRPGVQENLRGGRISEIRGPCSTTCSSSELWVVKSCIRVASLGQHLVRRKSFQSASTTNMSWILAGTLPSFISPTPSHLPLFEASTWLSLKFEVSKPMLILCSSVNSFGIDDHKLNIKFSLNCKMGITLHEII